MQDRNGRGAVEGGTENSGKKALVNVLDVSKSFERTRVLTEVSMEIQSGSIHGLVGKNGSGKTTLIKILAGILKPDPGGIIRVHHDMDFEDRAAATGSGLLKCRFVHQGLGLIEELSAVENMALAARYCTRGLGRIDWKAQRRQAAHQVASMNTSLNLDCPVARLRPAERTVVAIASALQGSTGHRTLLVLDEPTTAFSGPEVEQLFRILFGLRDQGVGVLYVSHHLREVTDLADRVTVLRGGEVVVTAPVDQFRGDRGHERLVEAIVGSPAVGDSQIGMTSEPIAGSVSNSERLGVTSPRPPILRLVDVGAKETKGLTLEVCAGEIVGIAGLDGSGRGEVSKLIAGTLHHKSGQILLDGNRVSRMTSKVGRRLGVGVVPADRQLDGRIDQFSGGENLTLGNLGMLGFRTRIPPKKEAAIFNVWSERLNIVPANSNLAMPSFSGGNQQKIIVLACSGSRATVAVP